jgi:hypothetical protein
MSLEFYVDYSGYSGETTAKPEKREIFPFQAKSSEILGASSELGKTFETPCIPADYLVKPNNKELMQNHTIDVEHSCKQFHPECCPLKKALTSVQNQRISHPTSSMYLHRISGFLESDFGEY